MRRIICSLVTAGLALSAAPASADDFSPLTKTEAFRATRITATNLVMPFTERTPKVTIACERTTASPKYGDRFHCRARVTADRVKLRFETTVVQVIGNNGVSVMVFARNLRISP